MNNAFGRVIIRVIMKEIDKINKAYKYLSRIYAKPIDTILVLGSGLGALADEVDDAIVVSCRDIPYIKTSTTPYHDGKLVLGTISGKSVAVMSGRVHLYEDITPNDVVRLIRVLSLMGAKRIVLTNSAGAINREYKVGDVVAIRDHVSLFVPSSLTGDIRREIGDKLNFVDMSEVYDSNYLGLLDEIAKEQNLDLKTGVYVQLSGAQYETPSEIRLLDKLGCDLVGMSTVIESIASRHLGLKIVAFSIITNMASGIEKVKLSHEEVKIVANKTGEKLKSIIKKFLEKID